MKDDEARPGLRIMTKRLRKDGTMGIAIKTKHPLPLWHDEMIKAGLRTGILDRLKFHNGLPLKQIVENTGINARTIKKHADRLVDDGLAVWTRRSAEPNDWILRVV